MKKLSYVITVAVCLCATTVSAQINDKIYGKPEDFKAMAKRTLVVELLEEDPKVIAKLSKSEKKADQLKDYKSFIGEYNTKIQEAVPKFWTFNTAIEYKKESETKQLREAKSTKYVLLAYTELKDAYDEPMERSWLSVPALILHRTDRPIRTPDYKIYLPSSYSRDNTNYLPCDFKFALVQMQNNLNYNIKNNVVLNFEEYAEKMMEANCSKLPKLKLLVEKQYLYKSVTEAEAKENYGKNIAFVDGNAVNESYMNSKSGEAVLFAVPFGLLKGSLGPVNMAALAYIKVILDSETGEILYIHLPKMGTSYVAQILKGEFKKMAECK